MSRRFFIEDEAGRRPIAAERFPLTLGGAGCDVVLPGAGASEPLAYFGLSEGDVFVQPAKAGGVVVNGAFLATSQWVHDGDIIRVGSARLEVAVRDTSVRFTVSPLEPRSKEAVKPATTADAGSTIRPIAFTPKPAAELRRRRQGRHLPALTFWAAVVLLGTFGWYVFAARSVSVTIEPRPDRIRIRGGFPIGFGERFLLHPGRYTVIGEKEGYRRLEAPIEVGEASAQTFRFTMEPLPGELALTTRPEEGVTVSIDGEAVGKTPMDSIELPPGKYLVMLRAERHRDFETEIELEAGNTKTLEAELEPLWAPITFRSRPDGATVRVAGESFGPTPVVVDLVEGSHRYEVRLEGHKPFRGRVRVEAGRAGAAPVAELSLSDGSVALGSVPEGANVTVDGVYRGQTPLEVYVTPGERHRVDVTRSGYEPASREIEIGAGESRAVDIELVPRLGEIELAVDPPDAELYVDGRLHGRAGGVLRLTAVSHQIEVRKDGYQSFETDVTPRPGFPQSLEVSLENLADAKTAARPSVVRTAQGHELRLVEPRRFQMGASRREPGRRANETIREVEITKAFYLAATEVTNRQFREFDESHRSGAVRGHNLEIDHHPVVQVTWDAAARYCNWLSGQDSLPPAYVERGGRLVLADPPTTGYRLPTEAEWALAARYPAGDERKYPWGGSLPVPPGAGNFADRSAQGMVASVVPDYDDSFPTTAPSDSFSPNPLGIKNLGGNVAEWTNDFYTIYSSGNVELEQDPLGPGEGEFYVIRGSSFLDGSITELRLSFRDYGNEARVDVGFRVARWVE